MKKWLPVFLLLAIVARWGSFFISVINHDESTYIVIADELLRGEVYLRDVIDTKPIGIFWLYAALIKLTGGSIFALRCAAACAVGLGGWGLALAGEKATGSRRVGVAAGVIYLISSSLFTYYGLSPNTEIYFNVLTIAAVALAVATRIRAGRADPLWHWPAAGFLLGLATIIKPFAAAEALAVGLFLVWFYAHRRAPGRLLGAGLLLLAGYLIPLSFVYGYYWRLDLVDELIFYSVEVNKAYPIELAWYLRLKYMGDYLLRYAPFVILGAGTLVQCLKQKSSESLTWLLYLLLQFLLVTMVVLLTGKRFGHYQIQLHPVLALMAATWWAPGMTVFSALRRKTLYTGLPWAVGICALLLGSFHFVKYRGKRDDPPKIAAYFQGKLGPDETIFIINGYQITYHLLDRPVPTPYVHSSLLFLDHHVRAFRVNERREAERIIADRAVGYLVSRREDPEALDTPLTLRLLEAFTQVDTIGDHLLVYRRK